MELELIKSPIQNKIDSAIKIINKLRTMDNLYNIKKTQVNFVMKNILNNNKVKILFIKEYIKLYEDNSKKYISIFNKDDFISKNFMGILDQIYKDLRSFSNLNEKINYENFTSATIDLTQPQKSELDEYIKSDRNNYHEDFKKFLKEYKRRSNECLDTIIEYLKTLISFINDINKFGEKIDNGFNNFERSHDKFMNEKTINEGKYDITNSYRSFIFILDEINEIIAKNKKKKKKNIHENFNKLNLFIDKIIQNCNNINSKINEIRMKYKHKEHIFNFELNFDELKNVDHDCKILGEKIIEVHERIKKEYTGIRENEIKYRIDILIILDITSSMESYIDKFKNQYYQMIDSIAKNCPESLPYVAFIGYKDLNDKKLGDDYINIDFTPNYEKIRDIINKIEPDGGDDIPEDVLGAFELCLQKSWKSNNKIAFLITDSPCHGEQYHNLNNRNEEIDNYINDNNYEKKMDDVIREFFKKCITLFCLQLHKNTGKMFEKFKEIYESMSFGNKKEFFIEDKNFYNKSIINKIVKLYEENNN